MTLGVSAVLLSAGDSSRFWPLSDGRHKSLVRLMGKSLIEWTIESLEQAGIRDIVIVQGPDRMIQKEIGGSVGKNVRFVIQREPLGMGDALEQARSLVRNRFLVLNSYHYNAGDLVKRMLLENKKTGLPVLVGQETSQPWNYGVFQLDRDGRPTGITEKPEKGREPSNLRVCGVYLLTREFFDYHDGVEKHHYSFEDALSRMLAREGASLIEAREEVPSLKYPWQLLEVASNILKENTQEQYIADTAKISERAVIEGPVFIGENTVIHENAVIKGPCYIGSNVVIGNNALVRDHTILEDNTMVGANAEVTRSVFLEGAHTHSGFFGDTILGEDTRIGAGTIFANLRVDRKNVKATVKNKRIDTGRNRLGGVIGRGTHTGIHCSFMPGVLVGSNSLVGPHTLVKENVPSNTIYYTEYSGTVIKKR